MHLLKQSTAASVLVGPVLDSTGAVVTASVIGDFNITKNGTSAALASAATATHDHNGMYIIALTTGNTDTLGRLAISYNGTSHAGVMAAKSLEVLAAATFDAIVTNAAGTANGLPLSLASAKVTAVLAAADVTGNVAADLQTIKTQTVTCAGGVTVPAATLASTTNITAGTIATVTNLTNAPTNGDFTSTMKTSLSAATPTVLLTPGTGAGQVTLTSGVLSTNTVQVSGTTIYSYDGTFAAVDSGGANVTLSNLDASGATIPDSAHAYSVIQVVAGTGADQIVRLGARLGTRQYAVDSGSMPVNPDTSTSKWIFVGTWNSTPKTLPTGTGSGQISLSSGKVTASLNATDVTGNVAADIQTIKTQTVTCSGGVTVPTGTLASTTNIPRAIIKNTALPTFEFLMTDSTNHNPATGKTVTCTRSIDGGAFGAGTLANTAELSNGIYKVDFASGDLNGGVITLRATATGCDDTFVTLVTTP